MVRSPENLSYLNPEPDMRYHVDRLIDQVLTRTTRIETAGTEENIPKDGPLVIGFIPHSGWIEPPSIDYFLAKEREAAVWVAKRETQDNVPPILLGDRRCIFLDREHPEPSKIKNIMDVLMTQGIIASAFEGTRYSNPDDINDVFRLGKVKPGLMRFAYNARVPIMGVVILGADQVIHSPERVIEEFGKKELFLRLSKSFFKRAEIQMRFLPPYKKHLDEKPGLMGMERRKILEFHNESLLRLLINEILKLKPDYPLGPYQK